MDSMPEPGAINFVSAETYPLVHQKLRRSLQQVGVGRRRVQGFQAPASQDAVAGYSRIRWRARCRRTEAT